MVGIFYEKELQKPNQKEFRVEKVIMINYMSNGKATINDCRRKEFLKKLCLILKQVMLSTFLVAYAWVFPGISLKRYWGLLFL